MAGYDFEERGAIVFAGMVNFLYDLGYFTWHCALSRADISDPAVRGII